MRTLRPALVLALGVLALLAFLASRFAGRERTEGLSEQALGLAAALRGAAIESEHTLASAEASLAERLGAVARRADGELDQARGASADVLKEEVATFFESGNGRVNWHYLPDSKEVIWFSERDNWGHLYLYDSETGKLKNRITAGDWNVTQLLRIDEKNRVLYFLGVGRETGRDPYFVHLYRIGMDGSVLPPRRSSKIDIARVRGHPVGSVSNAAVVTPRAWGRGRRA